MVFAIDTTSDVFKKTFKNPIQLRQWVKHADLQIGQ